MTTEELFAAWNRLVTPEMYKGAPGGKFTWEKVRALPEEALAYLKGESKKWPSDVRFYWPRKFPEFLVTELDGDNRETALRMLTACDLMCGDELPTESLLNMRACKALGKDFADIMNRHVKLPDYQQNNEEVGRAAVELYAVEAEAYAAEELPAACTPNAAIAKGSQKITLFKTIIFMALGFVMKDKKKYANFLKHIEDYFSVLLYDAQTKKVKPQDEISTDERSCLWRGLLKYHEASEKFRAMLRDAMLQGDIFPYIAREMDVPHIEELFRKLAAPDYCFPLMLIMLDEERTSFQGLKAIPWMEKTCAENPELLEKTFHALLEFENIQKSYLAFKLLVFMLKHGGGHKERDELEKLLPALTAKVIAAQKPDPARDRVIQNYAALYEHIPFAAESFDALLSANREKLQNRQKNSFAELVYAFFKRRGSEWFGCKAEESAALLLKRGAVKAGGIFFAYVALSERNNAIPSSLISSLVQENPDEAREFFGSLREMTSLAGIVAWLNAAYENAGPEAGLLPQLLSHKSKQVARAAEKLLAPRGAGARAALEEIRPRLKGNGALCARRLIKQWDTEKQFGADFVFTGKDALESYCVLNFDAEAKKLVEWIPREIFSGLRYADLSGPAAPEVWGSLIGEYLFLEEAARLSLCDKIAAGLHRPDLEKALRELYGYWLAAGADTKKKLVMAPCCIYGSDTFILDLKKQIEDWTNHSRGAIASFVVFCIALNGGSVALLMVDGYTNKAPNNQVKNTAKEAFGFAAKELGVSLDELSDRIVPDFGFNQRGEKTISSGERTFRVSLETDFSLKTFDAATGKELKTLPAGDAKKELSELKKALKTVVQNQSFRLERILINGRAWSAEAWEKLFVENPVMHRFALGLVWGCYSAENRLLACFRYMEDGSLNTAAEEEFTLPDDARITLAHPSEMGDSLAVWKKQLEDYEISQPLPQLSAPVTTRGEKDLEGKIIVRYRGRLTTAGKLLGLSKKFDMRRGEIMDGGSYNSFTLEDEYLKTGALLSFEYLYMGIDPAEQVPLENLVFYRIPEDGEKSPLEWSGEIKPDAAVGPADLPPRYISGMLAVFDRLLED
jgi:hypothetical protein